ncbi:hypothetical protein [Flavobacterium macrobrachii]|jgi:hypothetical protein|uniref:hypothetical protein n=1 Tax=Flavobacterium macrobrachii TaxID=591204 RepID=UPI0037C1655E
MKSNYILIVIASFTMFSCKTYTISKESFKEQFKDVNSKTLVEKKVSIISSSFVENFYCNDIKTIIVEDKSGKKIEMVNRPSIEMRVTTDDNKRRIMYFDTSYIENDTLYGSQSRLLSLINYAKIPLKRIIKIEVQDGGKRYKYMNF